jgi:glycerol-3-phosphate dehydrogenase
MLRRSLFSRKAFAYASAGTLVVAGGGYYYLNSGPAYPTSTRESRKPQPSWLPPSREQNLDVLKASGSGDEDAKLDLLIVGGGATGAGVAVDAASRGLKVALVERDDFSSGNERRSCLTAISNL